MRKGTHLSGTSRSWKYAIEASAPINFVPAPDKRLEEIELIVYIDVAVEPPKRNDIPPFKKLDTKIEIFDMAGELQSRWHIDLAKKLQGLFIIRDWLASIY